MKLAEVIQHSKISIQKHTPEILMGMGIAGLLSTTILAVRATPKALRLLEEKKKETGVEKLTVKETVKTTWKCYIPSVTLAAVSTGCLIGSSSVSLKRNAALATAYKIAETSLSEYRNKVIETIGERKEEQIKDKIAQDKVAKNPVSNTQILVTGHGNSLCLDVYSGRYFLTDIEVVKRAINKLNLRLRNENYISLNEFYAEVGLEDTKLGDLLGWNINQGMVDLDTRPAFDENMKPCAVIDFTVVPKYEYYKTY